LIWQPRKNEVIEMSEEMKQAEAPAPAVPEPAVQKPEDIKPEESGIGISEEDLSGLGDLSVLQNQDINLAPDAVPDAEAGSPAPVPASSGSATGNSAGSVAPADFQSLSPMETSGNGDHSSIDLLMDVPLKVTVELGRAKMVVREVLDLQAGSVVELDRMAGEVVDIFINERLIAKGEVVVVDDKFGVRITEMMGSFKKGNGIS
jgi:flagellar motor switch protein FliN